MSGSAGMATALNVVIIKTPRLVLRGARQTASDVDGLHLGFSDPEVMAYWSNPKYDSREQTKNWISKMAVSASNGVTDFLICERRKRKDGGETRPSSLDSTAVEIVQVDGVDASDYEEGAVIGKIGVWSGNEIGFLLTRSNWGKGLATEALTTVLDYLFSLPRFSTPAAAAASGKDDAEKEKEKDGEEKPARRQEPPCDWIVADIDPRNTASLGILKKVGFWQYDYQIASAQYGDEWVDSLFLKLTREEWLKKRKQ